MKKENTLIKECLGINRDIVYRKTTINDAYDIEYVAAHSWKETYSGYMPREYLENRIATINDKIERAKNLLKSTNTYYVAEVNNKVVGILHYKESIDEKYKDYGYLESLYVLKDYQGLGIGKELFKIAIKAFIDLGYDNMYLECLQGNDAINFYKKYGGKVIDTIDFPIRDFTVKADIVEFKNISNIII